ncbi:5-methylcytosine-specific restriction enzyme subunit McrB [Stieleria neptunia]|uniref:5-methylcytosine-specific restriction enzyme subunit McrB n=1 Tax=Stieleria neptunia TaxID=2527979 RepID=A0A518HY80_9BACT|nr:DUF3578 domain-containing protein [Stieleria neptunia]QDV45802.1 5-methylcytosine-specific restriction enzyme subunit McrB [Stieleria neptunia]
MDISDDEVSQWAEFWAICVRLLVVYPERPAAMSSDAEPKQLERQLKSLSQDLLPLLCENEVWLTDASVGKGTWAAVPWVAIFDSRESTSARQGVYPVIHLSTEEPVGVRIGLGVSATAFKPHEDEKAAQVWGELKESEKTLLSDSGFIDVVQGDGERVEIGTGNPARKYAKGMVFERFVPLDELKSSPKSLTDSLRALVCTYKAWVDRGQGTTATTPSSFLEVMNQYASERVVYLSPERNNRYFISDVDDAGCLVNRLDSNEPVRVNAADFEAKRDWLREHGGQTPRRELYSTVAVHMCYLQAADVSLAADRRTAVFLEGEGAACDHFISLIEAMRTVTLYKPVILALVAEAIRDGELHENHIEFDWLLPRFIARLREHGHDVGEQQLAEGFGRMAGDLFWLHAYKDPIELIAMDQPTPSQIRNRISHARLQEPFWRILWHREYQHQILAALARKWWPDMSNGDSEITDLSVSTERLIESIAAKGFIFQPWQVATYITALRTKPFVILAGVSGTGKSKLPALVAELTGGKMTRISVRPDWTDSSDVLGYVDLSDKFRPGVVLEAAKQATDDGERFHTCLIDEMNLARVEHYFAEVLSTIEDRRRAVGGGFESTPLISQRLQPEFESWQQQNLPSNLGIVGTVNMDESSHGFSRKVLDRAFTIELSEVDLSLDNSTSGNGPTSPATWPKAFWQCPATRLSEIDASTPQFRLCAERATMLLQEVNQCLVHSQLQVGYRTRDEVILFLLNAEEMKGAFRTRDGQAVDPLDLAIMMKVLPRLVGGSNAIRRTLIGLLGLAKSGQAFSSEDDAADAVETWTADGRPDATDGAKYPRTASRLCLMWDRLLAEGYTSFWL